MPWQRLRSGVVIAIALAAILSVAAAQSRSTALENLLLVFANEQALTDYQSIEGVNWRIFSIPSEPQQSFEWAGALRLAGFGEVNVPRGVGIDNQAVKANEGDARLSVLGNTTSGVSEIAAVKYRATADYASMLRAQLSPEGKGASRLSSAERRQMEDWVATTPSS